MSTKSEGQLKREAELFPVIRDRLGAAGLPLHLAELRAEVEAERQAELELDAEAWWRELARR